MVHSITQKTNIQNEESKQIKWIEKLLPLFFFFSFLFKQKKIGM